MNTPIALFVFNRPALSKQAIQRIASYGPKRLLVIADAPRNEAEAPICQQTIDCIHESINWDCEVSYNISEKNLGCGKRLNTGLDWVFSLVDRAIILEDDVEVTPGFIAFATQSLERYKNDAQLRIICARNALVQFPESPNPFFSRKSSIWGWATWAESWQAYRASFEQAQRAEIYKGLEEATPFEPLSRLQKHHFATRMWEMLDTWDMPWQLWIIATGGYSITAPRNLSANHGMQAGATHTTDEDDVRGMYPLSDWDPSKADSSQPRFLEEYDRKFTLLDLIINYDHPRRWKLFSRQRNRVPTQYDKEAWQIMLSPFDHSTETAQLIHDLKKWIPHPQLDALEEIFPKP